MRRSSTTTSPRWCPFLQMAARPHRPGGHQRGMGRALCWLWRGRRGGLCPCSTPGRRPTRRGRPGASRMLIRITLEVDADTRKSRSLRAARSAFVVIPKVGLASASDALGPGAPRRPRLRGVGPRLLNSTTSEGVIAGWRRSQQLRDDGWNTASARSRRRALRHRHHPRSGSADAADVAGAVAATAHGANSRRAGYRNAGVRIDPASRSSGRPATGVVSRGSREAAGRRSLGGGAQRCPAGRLCDAGAARRGMSGRRLRPAWRASRRRTPL